jgi:hypothetical protein
VSFAFLAAGSLGLLALLVGPVLAHMARQTPVERQAFGAMMLLQRLLRRTRRRRRVRDWLLLLLRLAVVALVVLAVARPELYLPDERPRLGATGRLVLIVDNSLSMGLRQGSPGAPSGNSLLEKARGDALAMIETVPDGVRLGLVSTAGGPGGAQPLMPSLGVDRGAAKAALERLDATAEATDLAGALRHARALLAGEPGEVVVFTDEAGPGVVTGAAVELERLVTRGVRVVPRIVRHDPPSNVLVRSVEYGEGVEGGSLRAVLSSYGPTEVEVMVTAVLPDDSRMSAFATLPPCLEPRAPAADQADTCRDVELVFTVPPEVPGGVGRVEVDDGVLAGDDATWFHLPRVGASRVLVVDGDPGPAPIRSEIYFLERALAPWGRLGTGITPDVTAPSGIGELDPDRHRVVFLANVGDPRPLADRLSSFVRQGGGLVISAGDNMAIERYNAALGSLLPGTLRSPRNLVDLNAAGGVALRPPSDADGSDLLAPFVRHGAAGFARMYQRRLLTLRLLEDDPDVQVHLSLDNGMPLLVERRVGKGRVLLLCGTVDLSWGNLPLQSSFLPFVQRLVGWLGAETDGSTARFVGTVGEPVEVELPAPELEPTVLDPAGDPVAVRYLSGRLVFVPRQPGAYTLALPGSPPLAWVAVNTPAVESDPLRYERLTEIESELAPRMLQRRVGLGPGALGLALLLLLLQAAVARTEEAA